MKPTTPTVPPEKVRSIKYSPVPDFQLPPSLTFNMVIVSMIWLAILLVLGAMFTGYQKLYVLAVGVCLLIMAGIGVKMIGRRLSK